MKPVTETIKSQRKRFTEVTDQQISQLISSKLKFKIKSDSVVLHPAVSDPKALTIIESKWHKLSDQNHFSYTEQWHKELESNGEMLYFGGEVSVKYALAVQVLQPSGDVQRQTDPHTPRQVQITVQQLLQVTSVDILQRERYFISIWNNFVMWCPQMYQHMYACMKQGEGKRKQD